MNSESAPSGNGPPLHSKLVPRDLRRLGRACVRAVVDLLYPPSCLVCGVRPLDDPTDVLVCPECITACRSAVPGCRQCGMPLARGISASDSCAHCRDASLHFASVSAFGLYCDRLQDVVLRMKLSANEPLALAMGKLLAELLRSEEGEPPDLVAPVPSHWSRQWSRGTNPAALLAETICRRLHWRFAPGLLRCRRRTEKQGTLSPAERKRNVRGAFRVSTSYAIKGRRLLLVDDVMTTGATADEAAKVLRRAGADRVAIAVLARATGAD